MKTHTATATDRRILTNTGVAREGDEFFLLTDEEVALAVRRTSLYRQWWRGYDTGYETGYGDAVCAPKATLLQRIVGWVMNYQRWFMPNDWREGVTAVFPFRNPAKA